MTDHIQTTIDELHAMTWGEVVRIADAALQEVGAADKYIAVLTIALDIEREGGDDEYDDELTDAYKVRQQSKFRLNAKLAELLEQNDE